MIHVEFTYLPVSNFAMQQNKVTLIRQLSVTNQSDRTLHQVEVVLTSDPEFCRAIPYCIEAIAPGETIPVESLQPVLSANYFAQLTERVIGHLIVEVLSEKESLFTRRYPIDILAYDQWSGVAILPEMLSAFITPNHPAIAPILKRATLILEQWTGNASLDEYQSRNPNRVRTQMAALYAAIAEQDIIYSTVPASFEAAGQRIRLTDTIMAQKLATCLDMALLYASCIEAVGIHPLIILVEGHAFPGGWLVPETFPDSITDDPSFLTKRTADGINEIVLLEATCMNRGTPTDFDQAVKIANGKVQSPGFLFALDVKRSRFAGIHPLPQRIQKGLQWEILEETPSLATPSPGIPGSINPYDLSGISQEVEVTKQLLWERKLLDLSLRNNLLNIRVTKNTLQLISADLDLFEDALVDGAEFRILPKPTDWDNPLYGYGIYQNLSPADPVIELVKSELTQHRLRSYLPENDLSKALTHLYRSSRTAMEENGANTLYIALGLLKWYETPGSERPRYAPLLLLPVEIIRKSAAKGYIIRTREEEAMMNITLLEMLRQNFGIHISGLDPLPTDESGVDVRLVYAMIRHGIKNQRKWDVEEQAILGIFSFNKFIMWNDIHHNSHELAKNKLVSSLINGKLEWDVQEEMEDATALDRQLSPADIVLPISADSSQLEAIHEAIHDKSFILHGPPGTGKSQTITNIITNALYRGKRVLFVAEKMAALSVVQNRLAAIGLAPFCLELHSNKTKKTAILAQLKETTEVVKQSPAEDFQREADRLLGMRQKINTYIDALHRKYPFGSSLYDAITTCLSIDTGMAFPILPEAVALMTQEDVMAWNDAVESLVSVGRACGHPHGHPLTGIDIASYAADSKERAEMLLEGAVLLLSQIGEQLPAFTPLTGEQAPYTKREVDILADIADTLLTIPELTPDLLTQSNLHEALEEYREAIPHGEERDRLKKELSRQYTEAVLKVNAQSLLVAWNNHANQWFIPRYLGQKKIKKQLSLHALNQRVKTEHITPTLLQVIDYQKEISYLEQHAGSFPVLFGRYGKKADEDWKAIAQIVAHTSRLNTLILHYTREVTRTAEMKKRVAQQLSDGVASFRSIHGDALAKVNGSFARLAEENRQLATELGIDTHALYHDSEDWIHLATEKLNGWRSHLGKLKDWYQWLLVYRRLDKLGIAFIAADYKEKNIDTEMVFQVYTKGLNKAYISHIISVEPHLELFKGKLFDDVIRKYKELTAQFEHLTRKEIVARLSSGIPSFTREATQNSEVGILQRNIKNNARGVSIRRLFDQIPTLLSRMCPCMLMSPISVAQYIAPDAEKFDLVIFDEASQMPTSEAIGAIARGANVIIVGDPRQMPPTNFFSTNSVDEENIEMEDLESILDDCLALSIPSKYLLWHYRSRHESLIAFSNAEYYNNKLLTFPSPDNIDSKVKLVPIEGHYDKGKSRQNRREAQAIVDEIARRLSDPGLRQRSIGVVAFSSVQQTLIEDLLSDLFVANPTLETVALECEEPIFIKNLENVQGDERDVILFSIGYGPDAQGRVSMNFGPLNRTGGERRLNVAVSRARYEMTVYSTLRADQIDLNRTAAVGVAGLKRFLEYAEKGGNIAERKRGTTTPGIESSIAERIRQHGYVVHTHIGCSGYRIDMGIVNPQHPSCYILGILCDGDNYRKAKTTRDREIVQNSVLRQLGWNICRIWTMDWWENPDEVMETILLAIREAGENAGKPPTPPLEQKEYIPQRVQPQSAPPFIQPSGERYLFAALPPVTLPIEVFFLPEQQHHILSQIERVVKTEAPISRSLLCKRVLSAWGIARLGQRLDAHLDRLLHAGNYFQSVHEGLPFFWLNREQHEQYSTYRIHSERDAADLPPEEVANAIKQLLSDEISLPVTDLSRLVAQQFGFSRSGTNVLAAMQRGIKVAVEKGFISVENERAVIA